MTNLTNLFYCHAISMLMEWAAIAASEPQNLAAREAVKYWLTCARSYRKQR